MTNGWTPVSIALPPPGRRVQCVIEAHGRAFAGIGACSGGIWRDGDGVMIFHPVTHWAPLLDLPVEDAPAGEHCQETSLTYQVDA